MSVSGGTRRDVLAGLIASTTAAAAVSPALAQAVDKGRINNVLVIGYDYECPPWTGDESARPPCPYEDVALASAAIKVSNKFLLIKKENESRGGGVDIRVNLVCNSEFPARRVEGISTPAKQTTIDDFFNSDLAGTNVILYFIGHGFVGADGIEVVHPDGTSTKVWSLLNRVGQAAKERQAATRVAIIDCCRVKGAKVTADMVSQPGEAVAFIFSAAPGKEAIADQQFVGTSFTKVFIDHLQDQVEFSTLFAQVGQDLKKKAATGEPVAEPTLYTTLSRPVWLAGAPPAYGRGTALPLFFPG